MQLGDEAAAAKYGQARSLERREVRGGKRESPKDPVSQSNSWPRTPLDKSAEMEEQDLCCSTRLS